nr:MAG TPA: hypothetical protein [Caudoviricetes sp.]
MSKPRSGASLIQCLGVSPPLSATEICSNRGWAVWRW